MFYCFFHDWRHQDIACPDCRAKQLSLEMSVQSPIIDKKDFEFALQTCENLKIKNTIILQALRDIASPTNHLSDKFSLLEKMQRAHIALAEIEKIEKKKESA